MQGLWSAITVLEDRGVYFAGHEAATVAPRAIYDLVGVAANGETGEEKADSKIL